MIYFVFCGKRTSSYHFVSMFGLRGTYNILSCIVLLVQADNTKAILNCLYLSFVLSFVHRTDYIDIIVRHDCTTVTI